MKEFGERLKGLRKSANITQTELSEKLNIHLQTVSKWERGISEPDISQMGELAKILNISLEKLLDEEESEIVYDGVFSAENLGLLISSLRTAKNESQQQLAEICFTSEDTVSRWERGVTCPDINCLKILAGHFDVPVSKLYYAVPDEASVPAVVTSRKNRRTVAILASALAATTAAAAALLTVVLIGSPTASPKASVTVTVDGVEQTVVQNEWFMPQSENKNGYDFVGWQDADGNSVTVPCKVTQELEFHSVYAPHEYYIEYWLNGGAFGDMEVSRTFTVESGEVSLPAVSKSGATFDGWYLTDDYSGNAVTQISCNAQNAVIYAKWSDETYTVKYELNGGTLYDSNPTTVTKASEAELNNPLRTGYIFLGWYDVNSDNKYESVGGLNAKNLTLIARWQKSDAVFSITYELNGGTQAAGNPDRIKAGEMISLSTPFKRGYDFIGWNSKADGTGEYVNKIYGEGKDVTLFAIFTPKQYLIRYEYDGVYLTDEINPNYVTFGESINLLPVYRYGYDFLGWFDRETGGNLIEKIDTNNLTSISTLYAQFSIITYEVLLDGDGGTFVTPEGERGSYGYKLAFNASMELPECNRGGYDFLGWKSEAGEWIEKLNITNIDNMTLTAVWREKNKRYSITFETNGGELEEGTSLSVLSGEITVLPVPVKNGYLFLGWNEEHDESGTMRDVTYPEWENDLTLYAVWQEIKVSGSSELFEYTKGAGYVTITKYKGETGENVDLSIPAVIDGLLVKKIELLMNEWGDDLPKPIFRNIFIPEGVEELGDDAFRGFRASQPLIIPASVRSIGQFCFYYYYGEIYFSEWIHLETINTRAFRSARIPNVIVLPESVRTLEDHAFQGADIGGMILPEGLVSIGAYSLDTNVSVYIPSTVKFIGYKAVGLTAYGSMPNERWRQLDVSCSYICCTAQKVILRDENWQQEIVNEYVHLPERKKEGYRFLGWQDELGEFVPYVFFPRDHCTLYAVYEEITEQSGLTAVTAIPVKADDTFSFTCCASEMIYFYIDTQKDISCIIQYQSTCDDFLGWFEDDPFNEISINTIFNYRAGTLLKYRCLVTPTPVIFTVKIIQI